MCEGGRVSYEYVTLDALAASLSGRADATLSATYSECTSSAPTWSGSGSISADLTVGGQVKASTPGKLFILKGKVSGATDVAETLTTRDSNLIVEGNWGGLEVSGTITLRLGKNFSVSGKIQQKLIESRTIPSLSLPLPQLN